MLIALTGGIASGKTTVANRWVELGAHLIDADLLAREVVLPGSDGLKRVAEAFGDAILNPDGSLNRAELAGLVFPNPELRKRLEAILHPLIQERAKQLVAQLPADTNVIYVIPLLVEAISPLQFDRVVAVSAPESVRLNRLIEFRGMSAAEAEARIGSQATEQARLDRADLVIDSDCSLEELLKRADAAWVALTA